MRVNELFSQPKLLLEKKQLQVYKAICPLLLIEDDGTAMPPVGSGDGPPSVPDLGTEPTPPTGGVIQPPSAGGGWANGGPFRPYSGGAFWVNQLYASVKQLAVSSNILKRFKELGIKKSDQQRVKKAYGTALKNVRNLILNPQATAYHFPKWTTKNTFPKPVIKMWNEAFAKEFGKELAKIDL